MPNDNNEPDERLFKHLKHCQQAAEQMKHQGKWLWPDRKDSSNSTDMIDSDDPTSAV